MKRQESRIHEIDDFKDVRTAPRYTSPNSSQPRFSASELAIVQASSPGFIKPSMSKSFSTPVQTSQTSSTTEHKQTDSFFKKIFK